MEVGKNNGPLALVAIDGDKASIILDVEMSLDKIPIVKYEF